MLKENETIELKKSLSQLKEGIISLSSMLNKSNKGIVYFGINDESRVVGLTIGKKTVAEVTHELQNNLKPLPPTVLVEEEIMESKSILKVSVEGNDTPYSAYGRYYIRINDADIVMHSAQLQSFFESKEDNYSRWEQKETKFGIEDINEDLLIDCIRTANDNGRLNYVYRNAREALNKLGLIGENGYLNNAGLYLFGNNKPLIIKEANYPTDSRTEFGEIKEFRGNIIECIQEMVSYIINHISYKSEIIGIKREEKPEIPIRAIREIVVNSFAHCSYEREGDYNQCIISRSFVRIYNPGSILKDIDPLRFASGDVGSKIRNILIASTLFKYGYIDAFGTGFDRTFTLCAQDNVNYKYTNDEFGFTFIFDRKIDFLSDRMNDRIKVEISELDEKILYELRNNKYLTTQQLANIIGKSEPTISRHLSSLSEKGLLKRIGSRKNGYWNVL